MFEYRCDTIKNDFVPGIVKFLAYDKTAYRKRRSIPEITINLVASSSIDMLVELK